MSWHSDAEKTLLEDGAIASLRFGAVRKFSFKHKKTKHRIDTILENSSLLVMKGTTQKHWHHQLPVTKKIQTPRMNLTFRTVILSPAFLINCNPMRNDTATSMNLNKVISSTGMCSRRAAD